MKSIAIVGLGGIGSVHAHNLKDLGIELVGGVDSFEQSRAGFAESFGCPVYSNLDELLKEHEPDGIIVATPPNSRLSLIEAALKRSIPVLCEKPLAINLTEAEQIAELSLKYGGLINVGFCHRFVGAVQTAKLALSNGSLGELIWIRVVFSSNTAWMQDRWSTDVSVSGGGAAMDNACHALDLCRFISGSEVEAQGSYRKAWKPRGEDTFAISGGVGSGLCSVLGSYVSSSPEATFEVVGTKGTLRFNYDNGQKLLLVDENGLKTEIDVESPDLRFKKQLAAWTRAENSNNLAGLGDGIALARVMQELNDQNNQ